MVPGSTVHISNFFKGALVKKEETENSAPIKEVVFRPDQPQDTN